MTTFSQSQRRSRRVRRVKNRKGLQLQRAEGLYDTDSLSSRMDNNPDSKSRTLSKAIQTKLTVGSPNDAYEKEADRTADSVVRASESASAGPEVQRQERLKTRAKPELQKQQEEEEEAQPKALLQRQEEEEEEMQAKPLLQRQEEEEEEMQAKPLLQRQIEEEEEEAIQAKTLLQRQVEEEQEEEEEIQTKSQLQRQLEEEEEAQPKIQKKETSSSNTVASATASRIESRKGMGSAMSNSTQDFMQSQFKRDFSTVRIHNDSEANSISQKLNAQAFTLGQDIYFNSGKYNPDSKQGKHLLAHELTHVVQQDQSLKKKINPEIQRKCKPAPAKVNPRVKFKMFPVIKNNAGISSFGRTHEDKVKVTKNKMVFVEKRICGICGPENKTASWVIYPNSANINASIPVSINKKKINRVGSSGERNYIDRKNVMHTGFYTAAEAARKMMKPVLVTYSMTKKHEFFHVKQIENDVRKQLNSRRSDIQQFCPYTVKQGKKWKNEMRGGWNATVTIYSGYSSNSPVKEKAARRHSF